MYYVGWKIANLFIETPYILWPNNQLAFYDGYGFVFQAAPQRIRFIRTLTF